MTAARSVIPRLSLILPAALLAVIIGIALHGGSEAPSPIRGRAALAAATSLSIDECVEVEKGDTFSLDVRVSDVSDLFAWEVYLRYHEEIVRIVNRDVRQFLEERPNSNVVDFSDPVPNYSGLYRAAAADLGGGGTSESGSGVLVSLDFSAIREGVSSAAIYKADVNDDGFTDIGPKLTATGGRQIADSNGDGVFEGPIFSGQIAVGRSCADRAPTPKPVDPSVILAPSVSPSVTVTAPDGGPGPGDTSPAEESPSPTGALPAESSPGPNEPSAGPGEAVGQTPTPRPRETSGASGGNGGGSGGVSSWLIAVIAASALGGIAATTFLIYKTARRPA